MAVKLTYLGHSGFLFTDGVHTLCVDPFLTGNDLAVHEPADIHCDYIALTHGHEDHVGDTVEIAWRNEAAVIGVFELCNILGELGVAKLEPGNPGGRVYTDFGYIAFVPAFHSSSYKGQYAGQPAGLVIQFGDKCIYHTGDTALYSDMKLIGEIAKPDVACICCGDRFTMGPELATRAAEMIKAPVAVPIHYATFPQLTSDISEFKPQGVEVLALRPGESYEI